MFTERPITFSAAQRYIENKKNLPTALKSASIGLRWPSYVRGHAFFSARVASAGILQRLRKEVEAVARGDYNYSEARTRLKEFLAREGYGIPTPGDKGDGNVEDLASTRRLNMILRQNVAMAHAVGQREVSEHAAVKALLPNYEYAATMDGNARDTHAALHGLILSKDDPFWKTHFPPWDFNCRCMVFDTAAPANGRTTGMQRGEGTIGQVAYQGRAQQMMPGKSGYVFRSDPSSAFRSPDWEAIEDTEMRARAKQMWRKIVGSEDGK